MKRFIAIPNLTLCNLRGTESRLFRGVVRKTSVRLVVIMGATSDVESDERSDESSEERKSLFRKVQSDSDICGNCFRRTHNRFRRNYAVDVYKVDDFEWDTWARPVDLPDDVVAFKPNRDTVPATSVTRGLHGVCKCGFPSGEQLRPLPKSLFFSYAGNLLRRYSELGILFDEMRFFELLKTYKSDPSEQFADDRLYDKATNETLKYRDSGES